MLEWTQWQTGSTSPRLAGFAHLPHRGDMETIIAILVILWLLDVI